MAIVKGDTQGETKPAQRDAVPPSSAVNTFHTNSDVDRSQDGQHHTIGIGRNKASSGTHNHGGKDSRKIAFGMSAVLTGDKTNATLAEVDNTINKLVALLQQFIDFQDNRTP